MYGAGIPVPANSGKCLGVARLTCAQGWQFVRIAGHSESLTYVLRSVFTLGPSISVGCF
jgi:hypothetical protein